MDFAQYSAAGWKLCRIPDQQKSPGYRQWQIRPMDAQPPPGYGFGLLHALSGTCAVDIDDLEKAAKWFASKQVDIYALLNAPDVVRIDSPHANHAKLLYRLPIPLTSRKVVSNLAKNIIDFRCASRDGLSLQDVLPPTLHPLKRHYAWGGNGDWRNLPEIPQQLLNVWLELLEVDDQARIPVEGQVPASMADIHGALAAIDPDIDRDSWVHIGMALATVGPELFDVWDSWSAKGTKYYAAEMRTQWRSFRRHPKGVGLGTLFHIAAKFGWRRPIPDIADLFAPVVQPKDDETFLSELSLTAKMPSFNAALWPPVLAKRALELAGEVGCDPIVPMLAGLTAVSGAVDLRSTLRLNTSWVVPPTIWAMTIGSPSDKKTPGSKPMFKVLRKLEFEDQERFKTELLVWQGIEAQHAAELKFYREWVASPESKFPGAVPPTVMTLPPMPKPLRLLINDATTQKVVGMSESRPQGFLLYLDEMARWLQRLSDTRTTDDRGCWIQGYESGPYSMDRVGTGTTQVENLALALFGNCQPEVLRQNIVGASTDGILQRFLPVVLNPEHNKMWKDSLPEFLSSEGDYDQMIRRAFALPKMDYQLCSNGMEVFRAFCQWALELRDAERVILSSMVYQTALGKVEGNCARVILLFHLMINPYATEVALDTVVMATRLFKEYFIPFLRYVYMEVGKQSDQIAKIVFDMVTQWASEKKGISLADIRGRAIKVDNRDTFKIDQIIRMTMDDLESMGYVKLHSETVRNATWAINPSVATVFAKHRGKVIAAKKGLVEKLRRDVIEKTNSIASYMEPVGYETDD